MTFVIPIPRLLKQAKQVAETSGFENVRLVRVGPKWQASAKISGVNDWWATLQPTRREAIAKLISMMELRSPNGNLVN